MFVCFEVHRDTCNPRLHRDLDSLELGAELHILRERMSVSRALEIGQTFADELQGGVELDQQIMISLSLTFQPSLSNAHFFYWFDHMDTWAPSRTCTLRPNW